MEHGKTKTSHFRLHISLLAIALLTWPATVDASSLHGEIELEPTEETPLFGYRGRIAPELWGSLDPDWALCDNGAEQSPIDLRPIEMNVEDLDSPQLSYHPTPAHVSNNGHTVKINYEPGSTMTLGGETFELLQFHFHTPVGQGVEVQVDEVVFDAGLLVPEDLRSNRYDGSLTTPPCSEGVSWVVLAQPIAMAPGQMEVVLETLHQLRYASTSGTNHRPTQDVGDRQVVLGDG